MNSVSPGKGSRDFVLAHTVELTTPAHVGQVVIDFLPLLRGSEFVDQLQLGRNDHKGSPVDGVRTGRKNVQLPVVALDVEVHQCTGRLTDPVDLLRL